MQSIVVSNEILLEPIAMADASMIYNAIDKNRSYLSRWLPFVSYTHSAADTEMFIREVLTNRAFNLNEVYTIWYKGVFAGLIDFHHHNRVNSKIEMGYWLIKNMTGKGIVHQSCGAMIGVAFEKLEINRITIRCAVGNQSSEKVALGLGFHFEGIERNGERYQDHFLDLKVYSLLFNEFSR